MSAQAIRLTEVDIDNALANGHLDVAFQPLFGLADGALIRVEAFVRWDHPGLGSLPPGAFISFFEAQGRMGELTRYVIARSAETYLAWRGSEGPGFSVNLSQADLDDEDFPADLTAILAEAGLHPGLLTLECPPFAPGTEADELRRSVERLGVVGCPLAIEARGRACDVLRGLDPFPFDEIKAGGPAILRFARTARGGPGLEQVSELVDIAARHGARAVAVGIEDEASARALARLGFHAGQGKLLGGTGSLEALGGGAAEAARAALGIGPVDAVSADEEAPAQAEAAAEEDAPLLLRAAQEVAEDDRPAVAESATDPTALAIAKLKARKIAAKKAALARAEADRQRAEAEAKAARLASDTARRLQERLTDELRHENEARTQRRADAAPESTIGPALRAAPDAEAVAPTAPSEGVASEGDGEALSRRRPRRLVKVSQDAGHSQAEDPEAGLLLSHDMAEVALGVSRQGNFAEGLRLDGYAPSKGAATALAGAVAPEAEPCVREGRAEPAPFADVAAAIHQILAELPVPEDAKPRLLESASRPLSNRGAPLPVIGGVDLAADRSAEDELDAVVATAPVIEDDTPDMVGRQADGYRVPVPRRRPRRKTNLLTRKYRITHFWPRSWVRVARRAHAAQQARQAQRAEQAA